MKGSRRNRSRASILRCALGAALVVAAAGAPTACSLLVDTGGLSGGAIPAVEAGPSTSPPDGGALDATASDVSRDGDAAGDARCAPGVGPKMVELVSVEGNAFCIDATEVTQAQYRDFLLARGGNTAGQGPLCESNTSYLPGSCFAGDYDPDTHGAYPVVCVDWCDARAFCAWNGKRLCGRIGGGSVNGNTLVDVAKSQWFAACSKNGSGAHVYPYGATYDATACNTADNGTARASWPAGSKATCQGGVDGLFDMSGNVGEWEDGCTEVDAGPSQAFCPYRGGTFNYGATMGARYLRCDNGGADSYLYGVRYTQSGEIGFRCCAE